MTYIRRPLLEYRKSEHWLVLEIHVTQVHVAVPRGTAGQDRGAKLRARRTPA